MSHRRPRRPRAVRLGGVLGLSALLLLGGCGDPGELESAGATPTAVAPARLWPDLPPASAPAFDYGEAATEAVSGLVAPGGDLRRLDPLTVLRAQAAEHPDTFAGPTGLDEKTVERIERCDRKSVGTPDCPVLAPQHRDLTGDGRAELIVGIRLPDGQLAVRVFSEAAGGLTQVMETSDAVTGVQVAGRDLVIRAVSGIPGYEYRTVWSWDRHQQAMLPTKDEFLRVDGTARSPGSRPRPGASPSGVAP
ncbi:hypothetical protein [Streptomyces sp. NPDC002490]|uniref:hypothetical protein n=1 Tax=Streptomyces sp. NPDC002490 TaxID=3154416 RepID=UPI00331705A5